MDASCSSEYSCFRALEHVWRRIEQHDKIDRWTNRRQNLAANPRAPRWPGSSAVFGRRGDPESPIAP